MRIRGLLVSMLGVLCAVLALGVGSASAALTYPFDGQFGPASGAFGALDVGSVAVNDSNDDTYVADSETGVVDVFDSSGTQLASLDSSLTPAGSFGRGEVAVAANNGTGRVYVLDPVHDVVDAFDPSGNYVCQITASATPSASECNGPAGSATPAGGFSTPRGITVDQATGEVYVADANNGVIDIFSAGGEYLRQILLSSIPGGFDSFYTRGIAVDDFNDHVYISSSASGIYEFDASGSYVTRWTGSNTPAGSFEGYLSVAADNATGEIYVTSSYPTPITNVFASSGEYLRQFSHSYTRPKGTTVDQATGRVYVSDTEPSIVDVFDPATVLPDVTTGPASNVHPTSATVEGTVNPDAVQLSDCHFDYGISTAYGQSAPCVPAAASLPADSSAHAVTANLTGLAAGTTYHFRLEASNATCAHCTSFAEDATLATPPPPSIESASAANVTGTSADLTARIDPNGSDTTYHFQWGTSSSYGATVPVPAADIGTGSGAVSQHITGLSAGTTYHWRAVATNANGTTTTADYTFVYDTAGAGLPDNRTYEMVTPSHKNGALIGDEVFAPRPDLSEDGSRVILTSIQCFAGAESCNADRYNEGQPYLSTRTSGGWVTTALAPPASQFEANANWLVSAEADAALFSMPTAPAGEDDWYAREPNGSFVDVGPVTPPASGPLSINPFASSVHLATADLSHVVWATDTDAGEPVWPFDATTPNSIRQTVYEYAGRGSSQPILVGVTGARGSTDLVSECGTEVEAGRVSGSLSDDGRTVYFTAQPCSSGSGANAGTPVPVSELFARIDESRTVALSAHAPASECDAACQTSPLAGAQFRGAYADGSKAFFTSTQQLTNGASEDNHSGDSPSGEGCTRTTGVNGCNLYEYDFANPAGHRLLAVSAGDTSGGGPRVQGLVAISQDGSHVYFVAKGVLTGSANSQGQLARDGAENLYVFVRDAGRTQGQVAFIAPLSVSDDEEWIESNKANVTPDGRFLVFTSHASLTPDDTSIAGGRQVFRYDARTAELVRISIGQDGFNDNGNVGVGNASIVPPENFTFRAGPVRSDPTMSHDGSYVFFQSPIGLTPGALDDVQTGFEEGSPLYAQNVYEWHDGHVYLISDGHDVSTDRFASCEGRYPSSVCLVGTDATGANVFFTTADPLVAQDTDTEVDFYDARICTASEPCVASLPPTAACQSEACHGAPGIAPSSPEAATVTFGGPGNLASPVVSKAKAKPKHRVRPMKRKRKHRRGPKQRKRHGHTTAGGK